MIKNANYFQICLYLKSSVFLEIKMYLKLQTSYLLISIIGFSYLSQIKSDLVKGVLLGALIARQKSGEKIIVIPVK